MQYFMSQYGDFLFRILLASFLGALIGLEREKHGRAAGLRTHLLVSMGAAVFTILSELISQDENVANGLLSDPARIAAQVVSGIGFLGAGVMAAGGGYYGVAVIATVVALVSLIFLKFLERFYAKDSYRTLSVRTPIAVSASQIIEIVKRKRLTILNSDIEKNYETGIALTKLTIRLHTSEVIDKLAHSIIESLESSALPLQEVKWENM